METNGVSMYVKADEARIAFVRIPAKYDVNAIKALMPGARLVDIWKPSTMSKFSGKSIGYYIGGNEAIRNGLACRMFNDPEVFGDVMLIKTDDSEENEFTRVLSFSDRDGVLLLRMHKDAWIQCMCDPNPEVVDCYMFDQYICRGCRKPYISLNASDVICMCSMTVTAAPAPAGDVM
eukprot:jgi/Mesvir1/1489/Mv14472-RA.1